MEKFPGLDDIEEFMSQATGADDDDDLPSSFPSVASPEVADNSPKKEKKSKAALNQYADIGGAYMPTASTIKTLPPDCYTMSSTMEGAIIFHPQKLVTDNLIRLPDSKSDEVVKEVETFWTLKDKFKKYGFAHKRGFLLWGPPGSGKCHQKDTPILMFDGTIKMVQDVVVGDKLMGDDSSARNVQSLARGRETMYKVIPVKGDSYVVNESHVLSLRRNTNGVYDVVDISIKNYLEQSNNFKHHYKGYRAPVEFKESPITIEPYFLGLWLGDGHASAPSVTTADTEVVEYLKEFAATYELPFKPGAFSGKSRTYHITRGNVAGFGHRKNPLRTQLQQLNVIDNKHIPFHYKVNSREIQLQLIAGLLDSDGHLENNGFDFISQYKHISDDLAFMCRSVGLAAYVSECRKSDQNGTLGTYFRVSISGHTDMIPNRVAHKKASPREQIKDVLHTGITVENVGEDDYYGFELDGNHRYLLGDFTVTHNTSTSAIIINDMVKKGGIVLLADHPGVLAKALKSFRTIEAERPLVVIWEDIDTVINHFGESMVLSILDGESQVENVVFIATTNYPERLDGRVINRPSRFDKIVKISTPNAEARGLYLRTKIEVTEVDGIDLVKETDGLSIAHLKELIVGVFCQQAPVREVLTRLHKMRVKPTSDSEVNPLGFGLKS